MPRLTEAERLRLEELERGATPGPWECRHPVGKNRSCENVTIPSVIRGPGHGTPAHCYGSFDDADFIAAARNSFAQLLADSRELQEVQALLVGLGESILEGGPVDSTSPYFVATQAVALKATELAAARQAGEGRE